MAIKTLGKLVLLMVFMFTNITTASRSFSLHEKALEIQQVLENKYNNDLGQVFLDAANGSPVTITVESEDGTSNDDFNFAVMTENVIKCVSDIDGADEYYVNGFVEDYSFMQLFDAEDDVCLQIENNLWERIDAPVLINDLIYIIENRIFSVELASVHGDIIDLELVNVIFNLVDELNVFLEPELFSLPDGEYLVNDISLHILRWLVNHKLDNSQMFICDKDSLDSNLSKAAQLLQSCVTRSYINALAGERINRDTLCPKVDDKLHTDGTVSFAVKASIEIAAIFPFFPPFGAGLGINVGFGAAVQLALPKSQAILFVHIGVGLAGAASISPIFGGLVIEGNNLRKLQNALDINIRVSLMGILPAPIPGLMLGGYMLVDPKEDLKPYGGGAAFGYGGPPAGIDLSVQAVFGILIKNLGGFNTTYACYHKTFRPSIHPTFNTLRPSNHPTFRPSTHPTFKPRTPLPTIPLEPTISNEEFTVSPVVSPTLPILPNEIIASCNGECITDTDCDEINPAGCQCIDGKCIGDNMF